jgi:hypothetical protein
VQHSLLSLLLLLLLLTSLLAGAYRMSGSPREYACPSDAEEHAALYNMACCYAQLGQQAAALTCLESILETGACCSGFCCNLLRVQEQGAACGVRPRCAQQLMC